MPRCFGSLKFLSRFLAFGVAFLFPCTSFAAQVAITEIMYDLSGTDTGREWIEIQNTGSDEVSFSKWKLYEANTNHGLTLFQGNATTSAGGFAIIADDTTKFLVDNPIYSGTLFGSNFSLSNTGETIELRLDGTAVSQVTYASSTGAAGDGNSLQRIGSAWQAATPTPGSAGTATAGGSPAPEASTTPSTSSDTGAEEDADTSTSAPAASPSGGSTWNFKPQIFVSALVPSRGVAGAPLLFDAAAVGVKKEPLPNARYVWSFGDGGTLEGKKVYHTYHYPAIYVVMVEASSGELSATDRKEVIITAPELVISKIQEGPNGFIELQNKGSSEVDLSRWLLGSGAGLFTIPQGTLIGAKKSIPFPAAITNLSADGNSTTLLYPNGSLVVRYVPQGSVPEPVPVVAEPVGARQVIDIVEEPEKEVPSDPAPLRTSVETEIPVDAAIASSTLLLGAIGSAQRALPGGSTMIPWMLGVVFLVALSVGGYMLMLRPKREPASPTSLGGPSAAEELRREAASFDIIE